MRISTQSFFQRNSEGMGALQQKLFRVQQQLGSGSKFLTPSDDPVAAARALGVSQSMAETAQYAASRSRAAQSLSMEENSLQSAGKVLENAKTLIVEAGNGTMSDSDRDSIATALEGQFAQLLGVANSDDGNGQYLFAGYQGGSAPFLEQNNGTVQYVGDGGQRLMQVDVSRQMATTDDGTAVFRSVQGSAAYVAGAAATNTGTGVFSRATVSDGKDYVITFSAPGQYTVDDGTSQTIGAYTPGSLITVGGLRIRLDGAPAAGDVFTVAAAKNAGTDVFSSLRDLITTLRMPVIDATAAARLRNDLSTANVKITNAYDNLLTVRSSLGSRMAELDALDAGGQSRNLADQTFMSELQDLDYAAAIAEFSQRQTNLQATQQTFARLQGIALFNYL